MSAQLVGARADETSGRRAYDRVSVVAVACGVAGLVGFMLVHLAFALLSFAAIALGVIGARRVASRRLPGRALATAGYIIGALGVMLVVLLVIGYWITAAGMS